MHSPVRLSGETSRVLHNGKLSFIAEVEQADWGVLPLNQPVFVAWAYWQGSISAGVRTRTSGPLYAGRIVHNDLINYQTDERGNVVATARGSLKIELSAGPVLGNLPGCHPEQQQQAHGPLLEFPHRCIYRVYLVLPKAPRRRKPTKPA